MNSKIKSIEHFEELTKELKRIEDLPGDKRLQAKIDIRFLIQEWLEEAYLEGLRADAN